MRIRLPPWQRGVWVVLADQVLTNTGFFMLYPLLTVHLTHNVGLDATAAGLVLAARNLLQQGSAPLCGGLADRLGYKPAIVGGFVIRAVGFALFAVNDTVSIVLLAVFVSAVGGALFDPPSRASLALLTSEHDRQSAYAAMGTATWIGMVVGPLIGALLLPFSFALVSLGSAAVFLGAGLQAALFLPGGLRGELRGRSVMGALGASFRDREFVLFTALLLGYYFLVAQPALTVPLLTQRVVGAAAIGPLFAIQALVGIALQVPLIRLTSGRLSPPLQVGIGLLLIAAAFVGFAGAAGFLGLAVCIAGVAVGQLMVAPVQSTMTARLAGGRGGAYFGVGALALGLGGALGNAHGWGAASTLAIGSGCTGSRG